MRQQIMRSQTYLLLLLWVIGVLAFTDGLAALVLR
jgi:hypothetical protein